MHSTDSSCRTSILQGPHALLLTSLLSGALLLGAQVGCQSQEGNKSPQPVVEVTASDSALEARDTVPAGWVTFRMKNEGSVHHSFKLRKMPEGKTFEDFRMGVLVPADSFEKALVEGRIDTATYQREMKKRVPAWFVEETTVVGGITGLAPGQDAQITHDLEPGHYALSCLFNTPENRTHALLGVRAGLQVTDDSSGAPKPTADLTARLSPETFDVDTLALSDEQTVAFRSIGGPDDASSPFVGLFQLTGEISADSVVSWVEAGLPLPVPTEWIGGPEPMPVGDVAYVTVGDLEPGRYAWITEAATDTSGMVKTFSVDGQ